MRGRTSQEEAAACARFVRVGLFCEEIANCDSELAQRRAELLGVARVTRLFRQIEAIAAEGFADTDAFDFLMEQARAIAIRLENTRVLEMTGASDV